MKPFKEFILEKLDILEKSELPLVAKCFDAIQKSYTNYEEGKEDFPFALEHYSGYTIIGFRGTKRPREYIDDIDFSKDDEIHNGFKNHSDRINLDETIKENNNIIFTGHSLGAAAAAIKFLEYRTNPETKSKIKMLFCFGIPRLGSKSFETKLRAVCSNPLKELHFISLIERHKDVDPTNDDTDPVTHHPGSFAEIGPDLVDLVDFHSLNAPSLIPKFLNLHLHSFVNYQKSLKPWIDLLDSKI